MTALSDGTHLLLTEEQLRLRKGTTAERREAALLFQRHGLYGGEVDPLMAIIVGGARSWVPAMERALTELAELPPNWDSYGAPPIDPTALMMVRAVLLHVMTDITVPPVAVPTSRGGVQLEWHTRGVDLEIDVDPSGQVLVSYEDAEEHVDWEGAYDAPDSMLWLASKRLA